MITVPIAEELAFRGFLLRRVVSPAFLSVPRQSVTFLAILVSSLAFGLLHGDRWLAGTLAGFLYAFAYLRRGRLGDAVIAHATTNALLASYVILMGEMEKLTPPMRTRRAMLGSATKLLESPPSNTRTVSSDTMASQCTTAVS